MNDPITLWAVISFMCGLFAGGLGMAMLAGKNINKCDSDTESRGVFVFKDRAYKLTRINEKDPQ